MFRLTRIRIQNFKCFEDTGLVEIEPGCTTLIGMNQSGKSSFLKAIEYLGNDEKIEQGYWRNREKRPQIDGYFEAEGDTWAELLGDDDRALLRITNKLSHVQITRDEDSRSIEFLNGDGELMSSESLDVIEEKLKHYFWGSASPIEEYENITAKLQEVEVLANYLHKIEEDIPDQITPENRNSCIELLEELKASIKEALNKNVFSQEAQQQLIASIDGCLTIIGNNPHGVAECGGWLGEFKRLVAQLEESGDLLEESTLKDRDIADSEELTHITDIVDTWKYPKKGKLVETLEHLQKSYSTAIPDLKAVVKKSIRIIYFEEYSNRLPSDMQVNQAKTHPMVKLLLKIANIPLDIFDQPKGAERQNKMEIGSADYTNEMSKYWKQEPQKVRLYVDGPTFCVRVSRILKSGEPSFPLPPRDLSRGMQWYLGFFTEFSGESKGEFKNATLLLDDVAVHLHPSGQRELLDLFNEIAGVNQVLYSTHFPYLIPDELYEVRVFVQRGRESAEVYNSFTAAPVEEPGVVDSLAPIRIWIGITLRDSFFSGERTLIVEGIRDKDYLEALSRYRAIRGLSNIEALAIHPAGGKDQAVNSGLHHRTENKPFFVLLDSDKPGRDKKRNTERKFGDYLKGKIGLLHEMCEVTDKEITAIESFIKIGFPEREIRKSRKCAREFKKFLGEQKDDSLLNDPKRRKFWKLCDNLFKAINERLGS